MDQFNKVKDALTESVVSRWTHPIFFSFTLSWLATNYRLLFTLIGGGDYEDRFNYIDSVLYPGGWQGYTFWCRWFLIPGGVSALYTFLWPLVEPLIRTYLIRASNRAETIILAAKGEAPVSKEQFQQIQKAHGEHLSQLEAGFRSFKEHAAQEDQRLRAGINGRQRQVKILASYYWQKVLGLSHDELKILFDYSNGLQEDRLSDKQRAVLDRSQLLVRISAFLYQDISDQINHGSYIIVVRVDQVATSAQIPIVEAMFAFFLLCHFDFLRMTDDEMQYEVLRDSGVIEHLKSLNRIFQSSLKRGLLEGG